MDTFEEALQIVCTEKSLLFSFNPFYANGISLPPCKYEKTSGFLTYSGGIERDQ